MAISGSWWRAALKRTAGLQQACSYYDYALRQQCLNSMGISDVMLGYYAPPAVRTCKWCGGVEHKDAGGSCVGCGGR